MERSEIKEKIFEIFNAYGFAEKQDDDFIILKEKIDSLQFMSVLVEIEEEFEIEIPDIYLSGQLLDTSDILVNIVTEVLNDEKEIQ